MNTAGLLALAGLNALFAAAGVGVLAGLKGFASWAALGRSLGLAHMAGFALVGLLSTELLVAGLGIGVGETVGVSVGILAAGLVVARLRGLPLPAIPSPGFRAGGLGLDALGVVPAVLVVLLAFAMLRVGFAQGLWEWDAWAFWVPKGAGIYYFGHLDEDLFVSTAAPSYPILMPTLNALGFHFMGTVDAVTLHAQYAFLGCGFVFAVVGLLRPLVPRLVVWAFVGLPFLGSDFRYFAVAPLADLPLAYLFALGLLCLTLWLVDRAPWTLLLAGAFFAAAIATKREGLLFVAAAVAAAAVVTLREAHRRWLPLVAVAVAAWAVNLPWRFWWQSRGIADQSSPVSFHGLFSHAERIGPSIRVVLTLLFDDGRWTIVAPLAVATMALLVVVRAYRLAAFFLIAMALCAGGLVWILWSIVSLPIDTSDQTPLPRAVGSIILAATAVMPLMLHLAWQAAGERRRARAAAA